MIFKKITLFLCLLLMGCSDQTDCCEPQPNLSERCGVEPVTGPCYANIYKWYYDKTEKKCKEFLWGGCGGVVPFHTEEQCQVCVSE